MCRKRYGKKTAKNIICQVLEKENAFCTAENGDCDRLYFCLWRTIGDKTLVAKKYNSTNCCRVATAQGKQGIWFLLFPDRENTGNLPKNIKYMILHREFTFNTGKILKFQKLNVKPGLWWNIAIKFWLFDAKFQLVDNTIEFL